MSEEFTVKKTHIGGTMQNQNEECVAIQILTQVSIVRSRSFKQVEDDLQRRTGDLTKEQDDAGVEGIVGAQSICLAMENSTPRHIMEGLLILLEHSMPLVATEMALKYNWPNIYEEAMDAAMLAGLDTDGEAH